MNFPELEKLYEHKIFWHAMRYGEDVECNPERFEHFDIATVEAMSVRCVLIVFNGRGQPEIVDHGVNGFYRTTKKNL